MHEFVPVLVPTRFGFVEIRTRHEVNTWFLNLVASSTYFC
jgi:hypothetical protein